MRRLGVLVSFLGFLGCHETPPSNTSVEKLQRPSLVLVTLVDRQASSGMPACTNEWRTRVEWIENRFERSLSTNARIRRRFLCFPGALVEVHGQGLQQLGESPLVASVEADQPGATQLSESVPLIRATELHPSGTVGSSVAVAVIDTGLNSTHLDFQGAIIGPGYHSVDQGADVGVGGFEDPFGHGSHVSGAVASRGRVSGVGAAPGAGLFPARVIGPGSNWVSDWVIALDFVTANRDAYALPIRVVNISLSTFATYQTCPCDADASQTLFNATAAARASGLFIVAASGNAGFLDQLPAPACYSTVVPVGATYDDVLGRTPPSGTYNNLYAGRWPTCFDQAAPTGLTCFTNRNSCLELVAPGAIITAPIAGSTTALFDLHGTSHAAPQASGVAALLFSEYPSLTPDDVRTALLSSTTSVTDPALPGTTYAFLDAVDANNRAQCIQSCGGTAGCANPCDDGDPCTENDVCVSGFCAGDCDDGNPCTDEVCDPTLGCLHVDNSNPCDDQDACTSSDACSAGNCAGVTVTCDDGNACTDDVCNSQTGCLYSNNTMPCDDQDACTANDTCVGGGCIGGTISCDDSNECTDDSCDSLIGCVTSTNTASCDDASACTTDDGCANGICTGMSVNCDDGNECTDDTCDPQTGCLNTNNVQPCDDRDACTAPDACMSGACASGPPLSCDDDNPCTNDTCDPQTGCAHLNNTVSCDDMDACTESDACLEGTCSGSTVQCDDSDPCTSDSCDPEKGCVFVSTTLCDLKNDPSDEGCGCTSTSFGSDTAPMLLLGLLALFFGRGRTDAM